METVSEWRLSDHRGKVVVLLFYPGDETPVCTRQMCSLRDRWDDYLATGAEVVGISSDSIESHKKFAAHHDLPLRLLSDSDGAVSRLYGARSLIPGRVARCGFCNRCERNFALQRRASDRLIQAEGR